MEVEHPDTSWVGTDKDIGIALVVNGIALLF